MLTVPAGFEQHRLARVEQSLHQRIDVLLQQRLAAGNLDQSDTRTPSTSRDDLVERHLPAFVKRVRRVAPRAAQVARGQAHEDARPPGVRRLALDRVEDLVDRQHRDAMLQLYASGLYNTDMAKPILYLKPT